MRFLAAVLALCCAAASSASPASGKRGGMDWKSAGVAGQYRCLIPPSWRAKSVSDGGMRYGDGILAVSVTRHGGNKDSQESFLGSLGSPRPKAAGTARVSGIQARMFKRQYRLNLRGDESPGAETEWIYEETALVPAAPDGFWVLSFESPSPTHQKTPEGLGLWKEFLRGFKIEP
ncbi:MAG: hypothetical protein HY922_07930 [Elusimicrobia bacterium]|nr:hypothetical protein [Elusimicrobiota bacterium]